MKLITGVITGTKIDKENECMALAALAGLVEQIKSCYIPLIVEHDPRKPPIGRIRDAVIKETDDGEYIVEGLMEVFEPGDKAIQQSDSRECMIHHYPNDVLQVSYDKGMKDDQELQIINEIASYLGSAPSQEAKKSLDPITVLTICGAFVLGGIATGFLSKLGEDAYDSLKRNLVRLFRVRKAKQDRILLFQFTVSRGEYELEVSTFLTNPTDADIEQFLLIGLFDLDGIVPPYFQPEKGLKKP